MGCDRPIFGRDRRRQSSHPWPCRDAACCRPRRFRASHSISLSLSLARSHTRAHTHYAASTHTSDPPPVSLCSGLGSPSAPIVPTSTVFAMALHQPTSHPPTSLRPVNIDKRPNLTGTIYVETATPMAPPTEIPSRPAGSSSSSNTQTIPNLNDVAGVLRRNQACLNCRRRKLVCERTLHSHWA